MKIAFIGDIVGRPGRVMIKEHLMKLRREHGIDFVIATYEHASHGFGVTPHRLDSVVEVWPNSGEAVLAQILRPAAL